MESDAKNAQSGPFITNDLMKSVLSKLIAEETSMRSIYLDLISEDCEEKELVRFLKSCTFFQWKILQDSQHISDAYLHLKELFRCSLQNSENHNLLGAFPRPYYRVLAANINECYALKGGIPEGMRTSPFDTLSIVNSRR